jgi:hypothetical protein
MRGLAAAQFAFLFKANLSQPCAAQGCELIWSVSSEPHLGVFKIKSTENLHAGAMEAGGDLC